MLSGLRHDLVATRPPLMSVRTTARLLTPIWGGLIGGAALGRPVDGLLVALGGYVALFGGGQPAAPRFRAQLFAAVGLLGCVLEIAVSQVDSRIERYAAGPPPGQRRGPAYALVRILAALILATGISQ